MLLAPQETDRETSTYILYLFFLHSPAIVYTCFTFNTAPATRAKYDALQGPYPWVETGHIGACFNPDQHSVFMAIEGERIRTMYQTFTNEGGEPETVADFERVTAIQPYREWQKEAIKLLCRAEDEDGADPAVRSKGKQRNCAQQQSTRVFLTSATTRSRYRTMLPGSVPCGSNATQFRSHGRRCPSA